MAENVEFEINGKDNSDGVLNDVSDNLANVQEHVQELAQALKAADKSLENAQKSLSGVSGEAREAAEALKKANADAGDSAEWKELSAYLKEAQDNYRDLGREAVIAGGQAKDALAAFSALDKTEVKRIATGENPNLLGDIRAEEKANAQATAQAVKQAQIRNAEEVKWSNKTREIELANLQAVIRARSTANDRAVAQAKERAIAEQAGAKVSRAGELAAFKNALISGTAEGTRFAGVTGEVAKQVNVAKRSLDGFDGSLANTRYALHDISMTMGVFGAATMAAMALGIKTVADYETSIADIQRTSEMSASSAATLRDEFVQLASELPVAFTELGRIGELGGQLNVPAERIAEFTENVAMFGATTDVTVDAAATAFGRLDALLPDVQGNYAALGSSILKVGINSVATESEIISTTSQISAAGAAAGMSADQVIGLSASFASLGVAPEAARGTVIRVLGLMNAAISEGGDKLEAFAATAGMSAEQFANSWGTSEFTDSFVGFLSGIQKEGKGAQLALKDLGIWAARDQNNILKLSQNTGTVVDIMGDAATGMNDAGFMSEQFGIKSETLSAKLQILVNNFTNLVAQAGEISGGALGGVVDGLSDILKVATDLADNPFVQWLVTSYGAALTLAAGLAILGSGVGRVLATSLALQPVMQVFRNLQTQVAAQMLIVNRAAAAQGVQLTTLQARMATAAAMTRGLRTALGSLATVGGITAAIGVAGFAFGKIMESMKSDADKAKEAITDFSTLIQASASDTEVAIEKYGSVEKALKTVNSGFSEVTVNLAEGRVGFTSSANAAGIMEQSQYNLKGAVDGANTSVSNQTFLIGEQSRTAMAQAITSTDGFSESLLKLEDIGFNATQFLKDLSGGNIEAARAQLDEFRNSTEFLDASQGKVSGSLIRNFELVTQSNNAYNSVAGSLGVAGGAYANLAVQERIAALSGQDAGAAAAASGEDFDFAAEAAKELDGSMSDLSAEFENIKASAQLGESMATLIEAMGNGAIAAELMGGSVLQNVDTIQAAVEQSIKAGANYGFSAVESVSALFKSLQQEGVNTAALLSSLSNMGMKSLGGVSIKNISKQMAGASTNVTTLSGHFSGLANATRAADTATQSAGGSMDDAAESAKELAVEVRTLTDYAGDLASIWNRAFDIRFGAQQAQDAITTSFTDIKDRIAAARARAKDFRQEIRDLKAEGQQLKSDRAITEYFLGIANSYGDTLRAGELTAELAQIDADIAGNKSDVSKANKELKKAEDEMSTSLKGNSKQSIANREAMADLVQEYQKKIEKLAEAGLSEAELAKETEKLRKDFVKQAEQLGFNKREIDKYSRAFGDVTTAIKNVPKNVTVKANVNPALQALNEFKDKAKAKLDSVAKSANKARGAIGKTAGAAGALNTAIGSPVPAPTYNPLIENARNAAIKLNALGNVAALTAQIAGYQISGQWAKALSLLPSLLSWKLIAASYASGGFTGRGGKYEEAGIVHKGEYVIPQEGVNQATGKPDPSWMMRNVMNSDPGANSAARISSMSASSGTTAAQRVFITNAVELGIQSLHAMNNMGGSEVVIGDNAIARAASTSNVRNNKNGAASCSKKDEKMWFGTKDYMTWITPPLAGADSSPAAWSSEGTLLNGGGYAFNSFNSHKTYNYAWSGGSSRQEAQLMKSFADGTYGRGRIFFQEPNIYDTNVLPARLADPSLTADYEGPELVPNVATTTVATSGFEVNGLPVRTMNYPVGAALPVLNADNVLAQDNFVPVPDGKSLLVQAFYVPAPGSTGLGIYVVKANTGGEPAATGVRLTPNTNSGAVAFQVFDKGPGVIGYYIFIGRSTGVITGNMQVAAIHARIADTGETMIGEDTWMGGQGHSGVRFTGKPTYVTRSGINGGQIEYAATFKEVQD